MEHSRDDEILRRRQSGETLASIGVRYGLTPGRVSQIVTKALAEGRSAQHVEELQALEASRLDELQRGIWNAAIDGDLDAFDRMLRLMDRRAKLHGLDHTDKIAEQRLRLETEKVRLVALAFGRALDALDLSEEQRQVASSRMLAELRDATAEEDLI